MACAKIYGNLTGINQIYLTPNLNLFLIQHAIWKADNRCESNKSYNS